MISRIVIGAGAALLCLLVASAAGSQENDSVETAGAVLVQAPPPIPPPALLTADPRVRRARALLLRVEVFDTTAARLARQLGRLLLDEPAECDAGAAVSRALNLVVPASTDALDTVLSGLELLPDDPQLDALRDRATQAWMRRVDAATDLPALTDRYIAACPDRRAAPTPWLPTAEMAPVDGRVVLFVRTEPGSVAWVDGHPAGAGADDGWSAVVAKAGDVELCAAPASAETCLDRVQVTARVSAAYDLGELKD